MCRAPGPGPGVLLTFKGVHPEALHKVKERIHDMFWKKGRLSAQILSDDFA